MSMLSDYQRMVEQPLLEGYRNHVRAKDKALFLAAKRFREYEALHAAKPDIEKAKRNGDMALMCERALKGIPPEWPTNKDGKRYSAWRGRTLPGHITEEGWIVGRDRACNMVCYTGGVVRVLDREQAEIAAEHGWEFVPNGPDEEPDVRVHRKVPDEYLPQAGRIIDERI